jgi:hypothetical protein
VITQVKLHQAAIWIERGKLAVREAERAIKAAEESVLVASENHAAAMASAMVADRDAPRSKVPEARAAVLEATDEAQVLKSALNKLRDALPAMEVEAKDAAIAVDFAISAILAPHVERLLDRAVQLATLLAPLKQMLASVFDGDMAWANKDLLGFAHSMKPLDGIKAEVRIFLNGDRKLEFVAASPDPWNAARAALRVDAAADLPDLANLLSE